MNFILFLFLLLGGFSSCQFSSITDKVPLQLHFLDVGQGLSVLFEYEGRFALWDVGSDSLGFLDTLRHYGVDTLEWVAFSHWHRDHAGAFLEFPKSLRSKDIVLKQVYYTKDTAFGFVSDSIFSILKSFQIKHREIQRGDTLFFVEGLQFKLLWPPEHPIYGGNGASGVLYISDSMSRMLLMSDLEEKEEKELLQLNPNLRADLLQVGHHGSHTSSSIQFLSQVAPKEAVISVGEKNPYKHPSPETLKKLNLILPDSSFLHRTDLEGTLKCLWYKNLGFWFK